MQIRSLRLKSYRSFRVNDTSDPAAADRLRRIELYEKLRGEGCAEAIALEAVGWSRATCFRWRKRYRTEGLAGLRAKSRRPRRIHRSRWSGAQERRIWTLRRKYPFMGKKKLHALLRREGSELSESTVGRVLAKGIRLQRIRPCRFCRARARTKQPRRFNGHARRLPRGQRAAQVGQLVQIDHMTLSRDGKQLKEFKAVRPIAKQMIARVYSRATARNAKRFLQTVIRELPFPLISIQVDGGSEFQAECEQVCAALDIPLFVIPPKSPQINGCVERANDTTRVEFWNQYRDEFTASAANRALTEYRRFYHQTRPHQALDMKTPDEYLQQQQGYPIKSHM